MGIPSYFSYIIKNHSTILKKFINNNEKSNNHNIHNFYLDCNSIIYDVIHSTESTEENNFVIIIKKVCEKIDEYIFLVKPINNIYIAFDGVAPVAKLDQQRIRRFKTNFQNDFLNKKVWNTSNITPGTEFMSELSIYIYNYYTNNQLNQKKYNVKNIWVSCSDKIGEGEHKMFDLIRKYPEKHTEDLNTYIYGLDADLIMLSISHLPICKNIYLLRETPDFVKSINIELIPNDYYILDIEELAIKIVYELNATKPFLKNINKKVYDYIFLCFFLGNDFLPHFPALNIRTTGINKMLNAYRETINENEYLTDGKLIYWKNVKKLVKYLALNEEEYIKIEYNSREKLEKLKTINVKSERGKKINDDKIMENNLKEEYLNSVPIYERSLEKYINPNKEKWEYRYYKCLFDMDKIEDKRKKQICINYLEGLEWNIKYYTSNCADWRWSYHYNYPPLLIDLLEYIEYDNCTNILLEAPYKPVNTLTQLCYVLPDNSLYLLPENLQNIIKEYRGSKKVNKENDKIFVWAFCRYFLESNVNLQYININELEIIVNN